MHGEVYGVQFEVDHIDCRCSVCVLLGVWGIVLRLRGEAYNVNAEVYGVSCGVYIVLFKV